MKTKQVITGNIKLNGKLVPCVLIKRHDSGYRTVRLTEDCGAYHVGDKVMVGTGEFVKDDVP